MIEYKEIPDSNIIEFTIDGKVSADEYHKMAQKDLAFIEKHGKVRILKAVKSFEGFDIEILKEKLLGDLLKHSNDITHAALVADEKWIEQLSTLIEPAFPYKVRHYKLSQMEEAREWLKSANEESIEVTSDSNENFMCFKVTDKLTHKDYEKVLIPTLESVIKEYGKARLLVDFGEDFHGMDVAAMWDDTKFGLKHKDDFEKIAIVGGPNWYKWAMRLSEAMMSCEVKAFNAEEYKTALAWVKEPMKARV